MSGQQRHVGSLRLRRGLYGAMLAALLFVVVLVVRSVMHFTTTGPTIRDEIAENFAVYAIYAVARLSMWALAFALLLALAGMLVYAALVARRRSPGVIEGFISAGVGIVVGFTVQFAIVLVHTPGTILASWAYAPWRLVTLWEYVHFPTGLLVLKWLLLAAVLLAILRLIWLYQRQKSDWASAGLFLAAAMATSLLIWAEWDPEPPASPVAAQQTDTRPNILIVGNDTMRADRVGPASSYERELTPFINRLAERGTYFSEAYAPQGRTAPSITSTLTGTWPATHGVISNFVRDEQKQLVVPALPRLLSEQGYRTAAIGDWAASDIGKLDFGFESTRVSPDQWNFKYLLRQGPRDLRLFVSLFTGNRVGQVLLPEIYYLAGRPLTSAKGRQARRELSRLAQGGDPFMMMVFLATSHGPFGSEYPYYTRFSGDDYSGSAKFAMTRVSTPEEIAQRQAEGREAFDVQQLIDLYDGTVTHFDDEMRRLVEHVEALGIADNTIIVMFSDHGTDFFERDTWGQGNVLSVQDHSAHVPLLIVDPRRDGGQVVQELVRLVDVAPTLADLVEARPPQPDTFEGVSLRPFLDGGALERPLAAYIETGELISQIAGQRDDHKRARPIIELLEIPNKQSGTLAITEEGVAEVEAARQRAIRTADWMSIMVPLEDGREYQLFDTADRDGVKNRAEEAPEIMDCFEPTFAARDALAVALELLVFCLQREQG